MPFRKPDNKNNTSSKPARDIFVGRTNEINFFVQQILKPVTPDYNIVSISGQGGVGKSTLLERFQKESQETEFKDFCLPVFVNERQITPVAIMEQFADQLEKAGHPLTEFEKKLADYKEVLRKLRDEREAGRDAFLQGGMDMVGSVVETIPVAGKILASESKAALTLLSERQRNRQQQKDAELLENTLQELTAAFVQNVSKIADSQIKLWNGTRRNFRVLLFFDTYEQLAEEVTPWLLDYFLPTEDISPNIVLIIAGRDDVKQTGNDPKKWLPYNEIIYPICLDCFTKDETVAYLAERNIAEPEKVETIWELSKGLPLYLGFLTSNPNADIDPTKDVIDNFLRWEKDETKRRLALEASLFSRPFNQDDLAAFSYISETDRPAMYRWLIGLPFVRSHNLLDGRHLYHDVAQEMFSRHLFQTSPTNCHGTRRALVDYYQEQLKKLKASEDKKVYRNPEWLELSLALTNQLLLLHDKESHIKTIEIVVDAYNKVKKDDEEKIVKLLQSLLLGKTNNQINHFAKDLAKHLENYISCKDDDPLQFEAVNYLLQIVEAIASFPTHILARLYWVRGQYNARFLSKQKAIEDFSKVLQLDEEFAWAFTRRGEIYLEVAMYSNAVSDFSKAIELNPDLTWAYIKRGDTFRELKKYTEAIQDYNISIEQHPDHASHYVARAEIFTLLHNYEEAIADYSKAIELESNRFFYFERGSVYGLLKNYQNAIDDMSKALDFRPLYCCAYAERGKYKAKEKKYVEAFEDIAEAIKVNSKCINAFNIQSETYLWLRNLKEAKLQFSKLLEMDANDTASAFLLCWINWCENRVEQTEIQPLAKFSELDNSYPSLVSKAFIQWYKEHFQEALTTLEQAIIDEPELWAAFFWKGFVLAYLENYEDAIVAIKTSLDNDLPPILMLPLKWLEQDRPEFYQKYALPLLQQYDLI